MRARPGSGPVQRHRVGGFGRPSALGLSGLKRRRSAPGGRLVVGERALAQLAQLAQLAHRTVPPIHCPRDGRVHSAWRCGFAVGFEGAAVAVRRGPSMHRRGGARSAAGPGRRPPWRGRPFRARTAGRAGRGHSRRAPSPWPPRSAPTRCSAASFRTPGRRGVGATSRRPVSASNTTARACPASSGAAAARTPSNWARTLPPAAGSASPRSVIIGVIAVTSPSGPRPSRRPFEDCTHCGRPLPEREPGLCRQRGQTCQDASDQRERKTAAARARAERLRRPALVAETGRSKEGERGCARSRTRRPGRHNAGSRSAPGRPGRRGMADVGGRATTVQQPSSTGPRRPPGQHGASGASPRGPPSAWATASTYPACCCAPGRSAAFEFARRPERALLRTAVPSRARCGRPLRGAGRRWGRSRRSARARWRCPHRLSACPTGSVRTAQRPDMVARGLGGDHNRVHDASGTIWTYAGPPDCHTADRCTPRAEGPEALAAEGKAFGFGGGRGRRRCRGRIDHGVGGGLQASSAVLLGDPHVRCPAAVAGLGGQVEGDVPASGAGEVSRLATSASITCPWVRSTLAPPGHAPSTIPATSSRRRNSAATGRAPRGFSTRDVTTTSRR